MKQCNLHIPSDHLPSSRSIAVAVSGGVDSMVLLHLLQQTSTNIHVLHVNYQLRGSDSDDDQLFVENYCKNSGIPLTVYKLKKEKVLQLKSGNLQEKAREIRYQFFENFLEKEKIELLYLGHHLNDQLETFWIRLMRKSGALGLQGMQSKRGHIVRPLLKFSKNEIVQYALKNNLSWREDASNAKNDYLRNWLRNDALPLLVKKIPKLDESVMLIMKSLRETNEHFNTYLSEEYELISTQEEWSFELFDARTDDENVFVAQKLGWSPTDFFLLKKGRSSLTSSSFILKNGTTITKTRTAWSWCRPNLNKHSLKIQNVKVLPEVFSKECIYLDHTKLKGKLVLRKHQIGDRISPVGFSGSQLVSKILKNEKWSKNDKENCMVVTDDVEIHWVVGLKVGRKALATPSSSEIIEVSVRVEFSSDRSKMD